MPCAHTAPPNTNFKNLLRSQIPREIPKVWLFHVRTTAAQNGAETRPETLNQGCLSALDPAVDQSPGHLQLPGRCGDIATALFERPGDQINVCVAETFGLSLADCRHRCVVIRRTRKGWRKVRADVHHGYLSGKLTNREKLAVSVACLEFAAHMHLQPIRQAPQGMADIADRSQL